MDATEGLVRGMEVIDTGKTDHGSRWAASRWPHPYRVIGRPVDELGPIKADKYYPIHREAPKFTDQNTKVELRGNRVSR